MIGASHYRIGGDRLAAGAGRFVADLRVPGMLHAVVLRSRHAHARLVSIDAKRALELAGVRAVLTCVDPNVLPSEFSGRAFDETLLADLPEHVDPCGERGEFHTFAWDGPAFRHPVPITVGETVEREGFVFTDLHPA